MEIRGASICCSRASSSADCRRVHGGSDDRGSSPGVEAEVAAAGLSEGDELEGGSVLRLIPRLISGAVSGALTGVFAFADRLLEILSSVVIAIFLCLNWIEDVDYFWVPPLKVALSSDLTGAITGAVSGALAGRATESGLLRGAVLGAVAGAVLSVEVLKASRAYWYADRFGHQNPSSAADFIEELLHGRFVRDQFSPAMFAAYRWQISITDVGHDDNYDIFGEISPRGLSSASMKKLPHHIIKEDSKSIGKNSVCTICLQEMEVGDTVRSLPSCSHTFHLACVDKWLIKRPSCPICRYKL